MISFFLTICLIMSTVFFGIHFLAATLSGCEPMPIWWFQYVLRREVVWIKTKHDSEPFKMVVQKDPFKSENKWGYRYHHSKVGTVTLYPNGAAEYCGQALWVKV